MITPLPDTIVYSGFNKIKIDLSGVFYDADGDSLMYDISYDSLGTFVALIDYDGKLALVEDPIESNENDYYGSTNITVKAYDSSGGFVSDTFLFTILDTVNRAPTLVNPIFDIEILPGFGIILTDLSEVFKDEDGDSLMFSVSDDSEFIYTGINWDGKSIVQYEEDTVYFPYVVNISVVASDGRGGTADVSYMLFVGAFTATISPSAESYSLYPNPTTGTITIGLSDAGAAEISVYDITGKIIREQTAFGSEFTMNISDAASGIYFLKVKTDRGVDIKQVIKE